jgi:hypothetical protein
MLWKLSSHGSRRLNTPLLLCFSFHYPLGLTILLYMLWVIRPSLIELYQLHIKCGVIRGDMTALLEYVYN